MADIFRVRAKGTVGTDGVASVPLDFSRYLIGARGVVTRLIASVAVTGANIVRDDFERTVAAGGWGTPDLGPAWVALEEAASFEVSNSRGRTTVGVRSAIHSPVAIADMEVLFLVCQLEPLSAATDQIRALLRTQDLNNYYYAVVESPLTIDLRLSKRVAGVETNLVGVVKNAINVPFWIRASVVGNALTMRAWNDGSTEPSTPDLTTTDGSITAAGGVGVGAASPGAATTPFTIDQLSASPGAAVAVVSPSWKAFVGDPNDPSNVVDSSQGVAIPSWVPSLVNGQPVFQGDVLTIEASGGSSGAEIVVSCYLAVEKIGA